MRFLSNDLETEFSYRDNGIESRKCMVSLLSFLKEEDKRVIVFDKIVSDLDKNKFCRLQVDAIIVTEVLEYIEEPSYYLDRICGFADKCIISFKGKEKFSKSILYTDEIIEHMKERGFLLTGRNEELQDWTLIGCFERITPSKIGKQLYCTGCEACVNICPTNALKMEMDENGFYKPSLESKQCSECYRCVNICPLKKTRDVVVSKLPTLHAAWAKDAIRMKSSSGGVFYELATYVLNNGGVVFGVRWDETFTAITDCIDCIEDLPPYMYSKYVQSRIGMSYQKVKDHLLNDRLVLFVGTPCQIDGLKSFLDEIWYSQYLYTVDLVCFGVPSNGIFQKYLKENYVVDNLKNIVFREKSLEGWSPTGYKIEMKNGNYLHRGIAEDCYQQAFHGVLFRNETCEKCEYYKLPRVGDFTIGDFWGIELHNKTWNDGKGTSMILLNTLKAQTLWENIAPNFKRTEEVPLNWCENKGNRIITNARTSNLNRNYFNELIKKYSFNDSVKKALSDYHDVGIVCMMNYNIGNNLTNYALYSVIKKLGYTIKMIDMPCEVSESKYYIKKGALFYFLCNPYNKEDIFKPKNKYELYEYSNNCKMFLVASDQLWRDKLGIIGTEYFTVLDWVPSYKYKFSYATSTGVNNFEAKSHQIEKIKYLLRRFNKISVRERFGQELLDKWGIYAEQMLDPVFLCDRDIYDELASRGNLRVSNNTYVAAYLLDVSESKEKIVQFMSKLIANNNYVAMTEPVYTDMKGHLLNYMLEPCVEEWISMIKNSELVITDSFHGMCFALIYEKEFFIVFNSKCWRGYDRFIDLLSVLGLEDRIIEEGYEINTKVQKINYQKVKDTLSNLRKNSEAWLKDALHEGFDFMGNMDEYDFYFRLKYQNYIQNVNNREKMKQFQSSIFFQKGIKRKDIIKKKCGENKMVIGWGAGGCFRNNLDNIIKYSEIKYICDSNPNLWGTRLTRDITCISPSELLKFDNPMILIMVENAGMAITITNTLLDMGITNFEHVNNWIQKIEELDSV